MTNSLNTPAEALEYAYPLRVRQYRIRKGSGGKGKYKGGDGAIRRLKRSHRRACPCYLIGESARLMDYRAVRMAMLVALLSFVATAGKNCRPKEVGICDQAIECGIVTPSGGGFGNQSL